MFVFHFYWRIVLCIRLSIHPTIHPSIHHFVCPSIYPSTHWSWFKWNVALPLVSTRGKLLLIAKLHNSREWASFLLGLTLTSSSSHGSLIPAGCCRRSCAPSARPCRAAPWTPGWTRWRRPPAREPPPWAWRRKWEKNGETKTRESEVRVIDDGRTGGKKRDWRKSISETHYGWLKLISTFVISSFISIMAS